MGVLLAFYTIVKYLCTIIFKGPLNFNIEIIFWVFNGVLFGPFIGPIFSILCDTVFCFFTTGIAYWMIEYAIVAPFISLISWLFWKAYKENNNITIYVSVISLFILFSSSLIIFFIQLFNNSFRFEGASSKNVFPLAIYILISCMCFSIFSFSIFCLVKFYKTKEWKFIKWLYSSALISIIVILSRWIWGPFAYFQFSKRFFSNNIDFSKQYPLTLFGIVTKTFLTIPLASFVLIPSLTIIDRYIVK